MTPHLLPCRRTGLPVFAGLLARVFRHLVESASQKVYVLKVGVCEWRGARALARLIFLVFRKYE